MSQSADNPPPRNQPPDHDALRDTQHDAQGDAEDQERPAAGPGTPGENAVDEALGGADPR